MKTTFLALSLMLISGQAFTRSLKPDLKCTGKNKSKEEFQVLISDVAFAREVQVRSKRNSCSLKIRSAHYSEHSQAPFMIFDLAGDPSCAKVKGFTFLEEGFLKISFDRFQTTHAHILKGHHPITCELVEFNSQKLKEEINKMNK